MRTTRIITTIAATTLLALPLASCNNTTPKDPEYTTGQQQEDPPAADPADATPQERIQAYFDASDKAAAEGWKDNDYLSDYLVPELAEEQRKGDEKNAATGAIITGKRELTDWTVIDENDTTATIEFCNVTKDRKATKDGDPVKIRTANEEGESVAQFKLERSSASKPWMIQQQGYYEEGTTCAEHFGH